MRYNEKYQIWDSNKRFMFIVRHMMFAANYLQCFD